MKTLLRAMAPAAFLLAGAAGLSLADDLAAGEKAFKKCGICHTVGEKAKNGVGPMLNGLDGRTAGTVEGFRYSPANKNSGIVWSEAEFREYIKNPRARIPGTTMVFAGIKKDDEIAALWSYLKRFGADGKPR